MNTSQNKLRVAVAGTSFGGRVQTHVFQSHPRTRVVALLSARAERAAQAAQEYEVPAHYTDFEAMLEREKPDIVSIATPPAFHFQMTMAAIDRGIHVLCEKPFAMNSEEAHLMKAAADRSPVVAMIDFEFRFLPARAYALELVQQGYVGEVRIASFLRAESRERSFNWWSREEQGGGLLGAFGSHAVDMMRMFLDEPRRVIGDLATFVKERDGNAVTSDDAYTLMMDFKSGAQAIIQMTVAAGVDDSHAGIHGSHGQLVIPDHFGSKLLGCTRSEKAPAAIEIPERFRCEEEGNRLRGPFRKLVNRMVEAIDNGQPSPSPNFTDALNSQIILDAARLSVEKGSWIQL